MNRRHIIIISIVLVILTITVFRGCLKPSGQVASSQPAHDSASMDNASKATKGPKTKEEYEAVVKEKSIAFVKSNNVPIAFYGRVVDQDSKPLEGVVVNFYVTAIPVIPVPWGPSDTTEGSCVTDQNGLFSVEGKRGVGFGVTSLRKTGYRESGYYEQGHARYEPHGSERPFPDGDKPVDFTLIREDLPKAEEVYDKRLRLNWNAEKTTVDLDQSIGKLEFAATRTGRDVTNSTKTFEWEVKIQAIGFTMTKLPNANERIAPLEGYGPNARVGFSPDEKSWLLRPDISYAIRTNRGAYGLMKLSIYSDGNNDGMSGSITIYLNKSGSRNIDY